MSLWRDGVVDACVVINLWATGAVREIATAAGVRMLVLEQVATEARLDPGSTEVITGKPRRHSGLVECGLLRIVALEPGDLARYVELGRDLDDGEAATLAYAVGRGLAILTDERKTVRIVCQSFPEIAVVRTTDLLRAWGPTVSAEALAEAIHAIEEDASFRPGVSDPHRDWWEAARG
jgi:predicted nucleic acid-binding protein